MLLSESFRQLGDQLAGRYGSGEAASIARIVMEDVFAYRDGRADRDMDGAEVLRLEEISTRLLAGEPLQYVLGEADFFGLRFRVDPSVLIPRQETEELVAWILDYLRSCSFETPRLLDIGVGSGCIGITLKKKFPALQLHGLEKSAPACALARANAQRLLGEAAGEFLLLEGDVLDRRIWAQLPEFHVIASNPPYIPLSEKQLVPPHVAEHEPGMALFVDDDDPLLFYRTIAELAMQKLHPDGALFFECNEFNAPSLPGIFREMGFSKVELRKDLCGADRMVACFGPPKG